jgi:hypothetical protein
MIDFWGFPDCTSFTHLIFQSGSHLERLNPFQECPRDLVTWWFKVLLMVHLFLRIPNPRILLLIVLVGIIACILLNRDG